MRQNGEHQDTWERSQLHDAGPALLKERGKERGKEGG